MALYYVNKKAQSNGDHEVHILGCTFMPDEKIRVYLGNFDICSQAVIEAKKTYRKSTGLIVVVWSAFICILFLRYSWRVKCNWNMFFIMIEIIIG